MPEAIETTPKLARSRERNPPVVTMAAENGRQDNQDSLPLRNIPTQALVVGTRGAPFKLTQIILDEVRDNEVLVEVMYSGVCHTVSVWLIVTCFLYSVADRHFRSGSFSSAWRDAGGNISHHLGTRRLRNRSKGGMQCPKPTLEDWSTCVLVIQHLSPLPVLPRGSARVMPRDDARQFHRRSTSWRWQ